MNEESLRKDSEIVLRLYLYAWSVSDACVFVGPPCGHLSSCKNGCPNDACFLVVWNQKTRKKRQLAAWEVTRRQLLGTSICVRCAVRGSSAVCRCSYSAWCVVAVVFSVWSAGGRVDGGRAGGQAGVFTATVFRAVCSLVEPSVSAKLLCCSLKLCYGRLVLGGGGRALEGVATMTTLRDSHPQRQCVVCWKQGISSGRSAGGACCVTVALWWMCLSAWHPSTSVP